jgi:Outer membrane protein beta-barrel domain
MRRHITAVAVATALGFASVAQADEDSGFYAGVGVGQFNLEIDEVGLNGEDFDSDDTAFKVFGGWRFSPNFAVELAYLDFGAPEDTFDVLGTPVDLTTEVTGFAPYIVTGTQFGMVELFARLGYVFYDFEISAEGESEEESDEDLAYGLGIGVVLGQAAIRLEYEQVDVADAETTAIWLSGAFRF